MCRNNGPCCVDTLNLNLPEGKTRPFKVVWSSDVFFSRPLLSNALLAGLKGSVLLREDGSQRHSSQPTRLIDTHISTLSLAAWIITLQWIHMFSMIQTQGKASWWSPNESRLSVMATKHAQKRSKALSQHAPLHQYWSACFRYAQARHNELNKRPSDQCNRGFIGEPTYFWEACQGFRTK